MYVEFGNNHAIEGFRDANGDDPERLMYRTLEGQHTTRVVFPEGIGLPEAYQTAVAALGHHIEPGYVPAWIESDNPGLTDLLAKHYGVQQTSRPPTWGRMDRDVEKPSKKKKG